MEKLEKQFLEGILEEDTYGYLPIPMAMFQLNEARDISSSELVECNAFFTYMVGKKKSDLLGKRRDELGDFAKKITSDQKERLLSGERIVMTHKMIHHSGVRYCLNNFSKLHETAKGVFVVSCYFFDENLKLVNPHSVQSQGLSFPDIFFRGSLNSKEGHFVINEMSSEGETYFKNEDGGTLFDAYVIPYDVLQYENALKKIESQKRVSVELNLVFKNNQTTLCQVDFWKTDFLKGEILGVIHPFGDYDALLLRHIHLVKKSSDWIWVATLDGVIVFSNMAYESFFNMKEKKIIGENIFSLLTNFNRESISQIVENSFPNTEIELIHKGQTENTENQRYLSSITPFKHPVTGKLVIGGVTRIDADEECFKSIDLEDLTPTEKNILDNYKQYQSAKIVADVLGMSVHTVNNHLKNLRLKLKIEKGVSLKKVLTGHESF